MSPITSTQDKAAKRRARDAERKRLKRAANPEIRLREAARQRQRREADPEHRARAAALERERRAARKRQQREAAPDAARERAAKAAARAKQHAQRDARFKRDFLERSFGHSCKDENKGLACCCTHVTSTKALQTKASWRVNATADAAVETLRSVDFCSQTMPVIKVNRWTEANGVEDSEEQESCGAVCMFS
ncbi:tol-Pal system protein TolA isoform X2 [Rhipicephalus sanguineus]|uniref:tol-Pal system protein TolA isoform X2 n=1 Tax=Rhipicephalus sanguineus TaxID=34632 RepID=UPI0020C523A9|nr:tol-Pal system protein TolA isoform X2 [Rhipicephalus sanguineus]